MRHSTCRLALAGMAGAIVLGGCGEDTATVSAGQATAPPSREERLATVRVEQFLSAMEAKDDARACALMTPALRRAITIDVQAKSSLPGSCRTRAAHLYSPAKAPGNADAAVKTLTITGGGATATVTAKSPDAGVARVQSDIQLKRRDGRWLVDNF